MNFVILDLEWNGTYSRRLKGFINEIIEFGAVKVDENLKALDTFNAFIRPQVGKKLSGKIRTLTRISNEDLEDGIQFMQAVSRFKKWMGDAVLMTWGTSDLLALVENCRYFCGNERIPFLKKYVDLQSYCEHRMNYTDSRQIGLSTSAQLLGIAEDDSDHHRALNDSMLSLECFRKLYDRESLGPFMQDADRADFYPKLTFKTVIICDLSNPLIRRSDLVFRCGLCGRRASRKGEWVLKNKSYRAEFQCRSCGHRFVGRVQFKLKYDGLVVKKTVLPVPPEEPEHTETERAGNPADKEEG